MWKLLNILEMRWLLPSKSLPWKTQKRIFFTATLTKNSSDFDFGLRPAIEAGVIQDYSVMVPVLSEGDPRPGLVKLIQNLPLSRKILAFCNTVNEAQDFKRVLIEAGITAEHYNSGTATSIRRDILQSFQQPETQGGIRVLVTVDVLSEGVGPTSGRYLHVSCTSSGCAIEAVRGKGSSQTSNENWCISYCPANCEKRRWPFNRRTRADPTSNWACDCRSKV